jgi:hypothetical protein
VRVCALFKGEELAVSFELIQKAIEFLIDNKKDNRATLGLLRLVNANKISFSQFPISLL